ncbi:MAG: SemiSWEET transporter [Patescibacteria group bacterium]|nr:SemiSWEET transporter [Patescibacteria group bacterium]MDE2589444.1 SemiSWEET transporter [Patescibacteria group bacterium]
MNIVVISYVAAFCSMVSFLPQVVHTWRTRQTKGISLYMYLILGTGAFLWTVYGLFLHDGAIILTNSVIFLFVLPIIFLKLKHG